MPGPNILSHIVFRTSRTDEMVEWYKSVTRSSIVFRNPKACFLSFDDEHHRIGFIATPELSEQTRSQAGLEHVAFRFTALPELLDAYAELRDTGIVPWRCTNHGPTTSFYYIDPDQNHVELLYDNLDTAETEVFMGSAEFRANPMGLSFDPDHLLRCAKAGVPLSRLIAYEPLPPCEGE